MFMRFLGVLIILWLGFFGFAYGEEGFIESHGKSILSDLKYSEGFRHFDYVNPLAPKGGTLVLGVQGSYDSFNPFIIRGTSGSPVLQTMETLMVSSYDESSSSYGLLAEKVRYKEDGSWIEFILREGARFHDGSRVMAEDVVWSFETLISKGSPLYRYYYADVSKVEAIDERTVRFYNGNLGNVELLYILGQIPVLSKDWWEGRDFERPGLDIPLGSGAYRVKDYVAGRYIVLELVEDYWGKDLGVNVGQNNFAEIRYDYYKDSTILLEAFLAGKIDFREENSSRFWSTGYDTPAFREGRIIMEEVSHKQVAPAQGFVMNLRRDQFQDIRVREAFNLAFDFEDINRTITYGLYKRTSSYFDNSELGAEGLPEGLELSLLDKYRGSLPAELFEEEYRQPDTDRDGGIRSNLRKAAILLKEAGFELKEGVVWHEEEGYSLDVELLLVSPALQAHGLAYSKNLERLGVRLRIRTLDVAQYLERLKKFDYDMIIIPYGQSLSPGNEQRNYWGSMSSNQEGSRNYAGIENEVVDSLIEELIISKDRESLEAATSALDRVLLWNYYLVLMFHSDNTKLAYWDRFGIPDFSSLRGTSVGFWWVDEEKDKKLRR